jgi:hypothetical protein
MSALPPARLVQLAAAASRHAAASSRLEIYPRNMPADRALQLAQGALLGVPKLRVEELQNRVAGRYPEAVRLPDGSELDALLQQTDLELEWDPHEGGGVGAYRPRHAAAFTVTSSTTIRTRTTGAEAPEPPEEVQRFDERLEYAIRHGSFLVLGVDPRYLQSAERRLARRYQVTPVSVEALLIKEMKRAASAAGADWTIVRQADAEGPAGPNWRNLLVIVGRALPKVEELLMRSDRPILVGYVGLLARYDRLDLLDRLHTSAGRPDGPPGAWLLIPSEEHHALPRLDDRPLPLISAGQWARIPNGWVQAEAA